MATNKHNLSLENITEWLASTGFLFPRNEQELARFDKLYNDLENPISDDDVSCDRILSGQPKPKKVEPKAEINGDDYTQYRMVARKGTNLPDHILKKMKQNQDNNKKEDNGEQFSID